MNFPKTALLGLALAAPAMAGEAVKPQMDLSHLAEVLPQNDPHLAAVMTMATSRVAALGLPLELAKGDKPGEVIYRGVPNDQSKAVMDAVNDTQPINREGCVSFVIVPDIKVPFSDYKGPLDMGALCGENIPL